MFRKLFSRKNISPSILQSLKAAQKRRASFLNKTETLSKGEKIFYTGMGTAATFGILSVVSNGLSSSSAHLGAFSNETRRRLQSGYGHVIGGIALTASSAFYLFRNGFAAKMARVNPLMLFGVSFLAVIGTSIATQMTDYHKNPSLKYAFWSLFNISIAATLCPMGVFGGEILFKSAIATAAIVTSMSAIAASAPSDAFLNWGTGLGIGLGVLLAASIGQMFFPSPILSAVTIYGGLGLFSLFTLYDTQLLLKMAQSGQSFDPINASIGLYLNIVNIFTRMAMIIASGKKK